MNKRDVTILQKICSYCNEIKETHDFFKNDKDLFYDKEKGFVYRNSITMPILQIGELAKNLSDEFRKEYKGVPWREVMGMRDIFAHHYGSLDYDIAWNTSIADIPDLESKLKELLAKSDG